MAPLLLVRKRLCWWQEWGTGDRYISSGTIISKSHQHQCSLLNLVFGVSLDFGLSLNYLKYKGGNTFEPLIRYYCSYRSFFKFEFRRLRFYFLGRDDWGDEYRIRMRFRAEIGSLNCCSNRNLVKNLDFLG